MRLHSQETNHGVITRKTGDVLKTTVNTNYIFDCDYTGCDFKSSTHEALTHHVKRVHTKNYVPKNPKKNPKVEPKVINPSTSKRRGKIQYELVEDKYDEGRVYKCLKCICAFRNKFCITEHDRTIHTSPLPYQCPAKCGYFGVTEQSIKKHFGDWHKERNISCNLGCGKMFFKTESRNKHERRFCPQLGAAKLEQLKREEDMSGAYDRVFNNRKKNKARRDELMKAYNVPL